MSDQKALLDAAARGDIDACHVILRRPWLDLSYNFRELTVQAAAAAGQLSTCEALLGKFASYMTKDVLAAPLVLAIQHNHWDVVAMFLRRNACLHTALVKAAEQGSIEAIKFFFDTKRQLARQSVDAALIAAARTTAASERHMAVIEVLLNSGASAAGINAALRDCWYCCDIAKRLIEAGADDVDGALLNTTLVCRTGNADMCQFLLQHHPTQVAKNTALVRAADLCNTQVCEMLLRAGATTVNEALEKAVVSAPTMADVRGLIDQLFAHGASDLETAIAGALTSCRAKAGDTKERQQKIIWLMQKDTEGCLDTLRVLRRVQDTNMDTVTMGCHEMFQRDVWATRLWFQQNHVIKPEPQPDPQPHLTSQASCQQERVVMGPPPPRPPKVPRVLDTDDAAGASKRRDA